MTTKTASQILTLAVLVTLILFGIFALMALYSHDTTHAMSADLDPRATVTMHPSTIGKDEVLVISSALHVKFHMPDCHKYVSAVALKNNGFGHPACVTGQASASTVIVKRNGSNDKPVVVPSTGTTVNPVTPPSTPSTPSHDKHDKKDKKDKKSCDNGEGNGSEDCSPANSTHANNDENHTTPREDKSNNTGNGKKS